MKQVLVLDANQRSALAVTRSLGKRGIPIITADETPSSLAAASRFSKAYFSYPCPRTEPDTFVACLGEMIDKYDINMILPMTELTTTLLLENQSQIPDVILPFPAIDTVNSLADKCALLELAKELNIPTPQTWHVAQPGKLSFSLQDLPYPLILKPGKSWQQQSHGWARHAVQLAETPSAAQHILTSDPAFRTHPFMLQECVHGHGEGVFALYDHGRPLAFFAHRRLREKPPSGGVSVLSESVAINKTLLNYARTLLDKAAWHGVAMVEFKVDEKNGTPYLMEINTRFWGSLQLAIDAGIDFPWLLYQTMTGASSRPPDAYRTGIRLRWLLGDLDNLYLRLRDSQTSRREKLTAILCFLRPSPFTTRHEVNRWGDMGPFWFELKQYWRALIG